MNFQYIYITNKNNLKKSDIKNIENINVINSVEDLDKFKYAIVLFDFNAYSNDLNRYPNLYRIAVLNNLEANGYAKFENFILKNDIEYIISNKNLISLKYKKIIIDNEFSIFSTNSNTEKKSISQILSISETLLGIRFLLIIKNNIISSQNITNELINENDSISKLIRNSDYSIANQGYKIISIDKKINNLNEEELYFLNKLQNQIEIFFFNSSIISSNIGATEVLNSIHDELILLFNRNGKLINIFGNTMLLEHYNISKNELIGKFYYEIFYKELYETHIDKIKEVFKSKKSYSIIDKIKIKEIPTWHNIQFQPLIDEKENTEAILIRLREITELKEMQNKYIESKQFIKTLLNSIGDAIVLTDINNKIIDFNNRFRELFMFKDEIIGTHINRIFLSDRNFNEIGNTLLNNLKNFKKSTFNITLKKTNNSQFECETLITLFEAKQNKNIVYVIRDISNQKKMERSLIQKTKELSKINMSLENARNYQDKIFNSVADVILVLDEFDTIVDSNNSVKNVLKYDKYELVGKKLNDLISKKNLFQDLISDKAFKSIQKQLINDVTLIKKNNEGILANIQFQKESLNDETISSVVVIHDITANRLSELRAKASDTKFRSLFYSVKEIIIILDNNFNIMQVNSFTFTHIGYSNTELYNKNFDFLVTENSIKNYTNLKEELLNNDIARGEIEIKTKNGNVIITDFSASSFYINSRLQEKSYVFLLNDITEIKKVTKMKDEFVSIVSHELRSPLTSIIGGLGLILAGATGTIPQKTKSLIEISKKNADRLKRVINDILDIQKIESGKMDFKYTISNLQTLIKQAYEANLGFAQKFDKKLTIIGNIPKIKFYIDEFKFHQIMTNLISNAIKYSNKNSNIEIAFKESDKEIKISVINYGIGIPEKFQTKMFTKFSQAESYLTRKQEGTGLGLNITKQFVEKMNGVISFETNQKKTEFYIIFPKYNK